MFNQALKESNLDKASKAMNDQLDPHEEDSPPGSPEGSYLTIEDDDVHDMICDPDLFRRFEDAMPDFLVQRIIQDRHILDAPISFAKRKINLGTRTGGVSSPATLTTKKVLPCG